MPASRPLPSEPQRLSAAYCDRCARRASVLSFDDLTRQELCQDCCDRLTRRRHTAPLAKLVGKKGPAV